MTTTISLGEVVGAIKVPHNTRFDPTLVKKQLGIAVSRWDDFMYRMRHLAERKVSPAEAQQYLGLVLPQTVPSAKRNGKPQVNHAFQKAMSLFNGRGRGADLASASGTAWGLLNAVTEHVDHERRARSVDYRLDSAWFGPGAGIKQRALDTALELVT